jgi:hypothetical protein
MVWHESPLAPIFERYGHTTIVSIANGLMKKGYYQGNERSLKAYLSQVFNGVRFPNEQLREGFLAFCKQDQKLAKILNEARENSLWMLRVCWKMRTAQHLKKKCTISSVCFLQAIWRQK